MKRFCLVPLLALVLAASTARADDAATDQLVVRLQGLASLQGNFSQTQYAASEELAVSASSGSFKLLKPAYFIWEIDSPDSQVIVTDGQFLWHHDRDLETVTRRPVAGREEMSPLQVLAGDTAVLRENYDVVITGEGRYRLQPIQGNPGFRDLTLIK